jgi:hypothetical protein
LELLFPPPEELRVLPPDSLRVLPPLLERVLLPSEDERVGRLSWVDPPPPLLFERVGRS